MSWEDAWKETESAIPDIFAMRSSGTFLSGENLCERFFEFCKCLPVLLCLQVQDIIFEILIFS